MKKIIISAALIFGGFVFASAQNAVSTDTKEVKACCSKGNAEKACCSKGSTTGATGAKTCSSTEVKACSGHGHASATMEAQPAAAPTEKKDKKKDNK